jgi:hypothetical protein
MFLKLKWLHDAPLLYLAKLEIYLKNIVENRKIFSNDRKYLRFS